MQIIKILILAGLCVHGSTMKKLNTSRKISKALQQGYEVAKDLFSGSTKKKPKKRVNNRRKNRKAAPTPKPRRAPVTSDVDNTGSSKTSKLVEFGGQLALAGVSGGGLSMLASAKSDDYSVEYEDYTTTSASPQYIVSI